MDILLKYLLEILLSSGLVLVTISFFGKKYFGNKIDHFFNAKLEVFKHQLNISTETAKFDFQRKIKDFNLYTVKKHKNYVLLYELVIEAEGRILGLYGFKTELTYQEHNEDDLRRIMKREKFPEGKIDEVFDVWEKSGKIDAIKKMKEFFRIIEIAKAVSSFWALKNHYLKSKLYLSETIDKNFEAFLSSIGNLLSIYETLAQLSTEVRIEEKTLCEDGAKIRKTIRPQIEDLTSLLKKELSVGYYE